MVSLSLFCCHPVCRLEVTPTPHLERLVKIVDNKTSRDHSGPRFPFHSCLSALSQATRISFRVRWLLGPILALPPFGDLGRFCRCHATHVAGVKLPIL